MIMMHSIARGIYRSTHFGGHQFPIRLVVICHLSVEAAQEKEE